MSRCVGGADNGSNGGGSRCGTGNNSGGSSCGNGSNNGDGGRQVQGRNSHPVFDERSQRVAKFNLHDTNNTFLGSFCCPEQELVQARISLSGVLRVQVSFRT